MARRFASLVSASLVAAPLAFAQAPPSPPPSPPPSSPPNNAPIVGSKALSTDEDKELTGAFQASDVDGDKLTFKIAAPASKVKVTLVDAKAGSFKIVPPPNWHGADSFLLEVSDGKARASGRVEVTVKPVDDAPVLKPSTINATEDANARGQVSASDVDGDKITYAIAAEPAHGVASIDATTGAITYIPQQDYAGDDEIVVRATSGNADAPAEARVAVKVKVAAVNDAPSVEKMTVEGIEDMKLDATLSAKDVEGNAMTFKIASPAKKGRVTVVERTGAFTFMPNKDESGADAFTIDVSDGKSKSTATVIVKLAAVDDAPAAKPLALTAIEDAAGRGKIDARDPDGDALAYAIATQPAHGTATVDGKSGAVTYTGAADFNGEDAFTVEVTSGPHKASAPVSVKVAPANDAPVAASVSFSVDEDGKLEGVLAGTDKDGDKLTFRVASPTKRGIVAVDAATGSFVYRPAKDLHGDDAFTFEVSDGKLKSTSTASLKVNAVDDAPTTSTLAVTTSEDTAARGKVIAHDVDGDALTYAIGRAPSNGTATVDATGAVVFTPAADFAGSDSFSVDVTAAGVKATSEVSVKVSPVNDAPEAVAASGTVDEDGKLDGALTASDADGDKLTFKVAVPTKRGLVAVDAATGAYVFRPALDFHGDDAFTFEVSDGNAKSTAIASVKVTSVDDAPTTSNVALSTSEDTAARGRVVARDVDGDALTYAIGRAPSNGTATVDASGAVVFAPAANYVGGDSFSVDVTAGGVKATSEVSVKVSPVNDAPEAAAGSGTVDEDGKLEGTLTASDADGDKLTFKVARPTKRGLIAVDAATGAYVFRPALDFHGTDSFTFDASDGKARSTGTVTLEVKSVADAPVAKPLLVNGNEDAPARGKVEARDGDGDALKFALGTAPAHGSATVDAATGAVVYTPAADYWGKDELTVDVTSGADSAKASAVVSVKLAPVNDPPGAQAASFNGSEDEAIEGQLAADDVEKDAVSFKLAAPPKRGSVIIDEKTGALKYRPYANLHGSDSFTFDASDGRAKTTGTVTLTIAASNDAPVAKAMTLGGREDTPVRATMAASDVDGDKLTFAVARAPSQGSVTVDERSGAFTYTPSPDVFGEDTFTLSVSDGTTAAEPVVKVTLASVPDLPRVREGVVVDVQEDNVWSGTLPATSPDGSAMTFRLGGASPRLGSVALVDAATGAVKYTPRADVNGDDELAFEVAPAGATTAGARVKGTMKVRVAAVNDAPLAAAAEVHGSEDTPAETPLVATDADGDKVTFAVVAQPSRGKATIQSGHTLRYEPPKDYTGDVVIDVAATDPAGATSTPVKVTVHVKPVNDAPLLSDLVVPPAPEDTPAEGAVVWSDVDDTRLAFKVLRKPTRGTVELTDLAHGRFRYIPERNFSGPDSFVLVATDAGNAEGRATVRVVVTAVDDPPVASAAQASVPRVGRFRGKLAGYDPEGNKITFAIERAPAFGRLELLDAETGEYVLVTDGTGSGNTFFRFTVNDGTLTSAPSRVDLTVR